eukprot:24674_5
MAPLVRAIEFTDTIAVAESVNVRLELPLKCLPLLRYRHGWQRFDRHPDHPCTTNFESSSHD